jgi:protein import protein ZIM17
MFDLPQTKLMVKIFSDERVTVEDILAQKGDLLKKAIVNETGDVEFWDESNRVGEETKP